MVRQVSLDSNSARKLNKKVKQKNWKLAKREHAHTANVTVPVSY